MRAVARTSGPIRPEREPRMETVELAILLRDGTLAARFVVPGFEPA